MGAGDLNCTNNIFERNEAQFRGGAIDATGVNERFFFNNDNVFENNIANSDPDFFLEEYVEDLP